MINKTHILPTLLVLVAVLFINLPMQAKHSDRFMLGTYSYLKNGAKPNLENRIAMCRKMHELGYNMTMMETDYRDTDLQGLFAELDRNELDAWVIDNGWSSDKENEYYYSLYPLSISNHIRFEAEFVSEQDVKAGDGMDNQFWYAARSDNRMTRVGKVLQNNEASYGNVWKATSSVDSPGYIFSDLRLRWPNVNGAYIRFGKEVHLFKKNQPGNVNEYFWMSYRFKISNLKNGLKENEPLLSFSTTGYQLSGTGFATKATILKHILDNTQVTETIFRMSDYQNRADKNGFITVQIKVPYTELLAANLLTTDIDNDPSTPPSDTQLKLINFNPLLYWHGNCDVELDYVELDDQLYHDMVGDKELWKNGIKSRVKNIIAKSSGNVRGFYTFDEPYSGQFESFRFLQDVLKEENIDMFTATYDYQISNIAVSRKDNIWYDHVDNFYRRANPYIVAPDIYPIRPETMWNPPTAKADESRFIQNMIDDKIIKIYGNSKKYVQQDSARKFYPIVQVLGQWLKLGDKEQWNSWILPPTATQKSLLYLPLCFGPDGIIHFRARGFLTPEGYGDYGAMYSKQGDKTYPLPTPTPSAWDAVYSTNDKVKQYGELIHGMHWLDSNTIGTSKLAIGNNLKGTLLRSMQVEEEHDAPYTGYVQCGFYLDYQAKPSFMVVNRRGDYFVPGNITDERYVPLSQYTNYYTEAAPQTVRFEFDRKIYKTIGKYPKLYDPATHKMTIISDRETSITLGAGEGIFVQVVNSLPELVKGSNSLKGKTVISGTVVLRKKAKINLGTDAELVLLPGSTLVVPENSSLNLSGKLTLLGDAKIKIEGKLKNKAQKINYAPDSSIILHGKPLSK